MNWWKQGYVRRRFNVILTPIGQFWPIGAPKSIRSAENPIWPQFLIWKREKSWNIYHCGHRCGRRWGRGWVHSRGGRERSVNHTVCPPEEGPPEWIIKWCIYIYDSQKLHLRTKYNTIQCIQESLQIKGQVNDLFSIHQMMFYSKKVTSFHQHFLSDQEHEKGVLQTLIVWKLREMCRING